MREDEVDKRICETLNELELFRGREVQLREELDRREQERDNLSKVSLLMKSKEAKLHEITLCLEEKVDPFLSKHMLKAESISERKILTERLLEKLVENHLRVTRDLLDFQKLHAITCKELEEAELKYSKEKSSRDIKKSNLCSQLGSSFEDNTYDLFNSVTEKARKINDLSSDLAVRRNAIEHLEKRISDFSVKEECETCGRGFEDGNSREEFLDVQKTMLKARRIEFLDIEKLHSDTESELIELKKTETDVKELFCVNENLSVITAQIVDLVREVEETTKRVKHSESMVLVSQETLQETRDSLQQIVFLKKSEKELNDIVEQLNELQRKNETLTGSQSLTEVSDEYSVACNKVHLLTSSLEELRSKNDNYSKELQIARDRVHVKQREVDQKQSALKRSKDWIQRHSTLREKIDKTQSVLCSIDTKIKETDTKLTKIVNDKKDLTTQHEAITRTAKTKMNEALANLDYMRTNVDRFIKGSEINYSERVHVAFIALEKAKKEYEEVRSLEVQRRERLNWIMESLKKEEAVARDLSLVVEIYKAKDDIQKVENNILAIDDSTRSLRENILKDKTLKEIIEFSSRDSVETVQTKLKQLFSRIQLESSRFSGSMEPLLADIRVRRLKLEDEKYLDIERRLASTQIKLRTAELAYADVEKYAKGLDRAVTQYHADKMRELNEIISQMWQATYAGSDIDTIEIKFDEDASGSMATRRNYKYRVIMRKGDVDLDLRGRCSAGQKVLASVIIRLALSDAFCCDCGVLVLDEPTTNLDEENILSLARALRNIIESRKGLRHFQLVVITHDEPFVRELGHSNLCESYYYVHKTMDGRYSVIDKLPIGELLSS